MKVRTKIAFRYTSVIAIIMLVFVIVIYWVSTKDREKEFYDGLRREGVSKASLYFGAKATPEIMHSIYKNNIEYIDEVEVAIYDKNNNLLYHDAKDIDIIKETPELLQTVIDSEKDIKFYEGKFQSVLFLFTYDNTDYIVTAAAYDGYGYVKLHNLAINLLIIFLSSIILSLITGYFLAKRALMPVAEISDKMKDITANDLNLRLMQYGGDNEFGELAASFNKALDIIESSFDSQKMFVSNVSHELRTPLTTLIGEIDLALLKDRNLDEYKETLIVTHQDLTHLSELVTDLLDFAKANYDESKISMTDLRIDEILLDARTDVLKRNPDYTIKLYFDQDTGNDEEVTLKGNEYLLKVAFINLIENNCKYSENKTSSIHISYSYNKIILQFTDRGIGISKEEIGHIYTPFFRGKNKIFAEGNGIGLALVKKVITLHKGIIEVESEVGEGTSFIVRF
jgi:two-component system sensor histidine kinase ArlS